MKKWLKIIPPTAAAISLFSDGTYKQKTVAKEKLAQLALSVQRRINLEHGQDKEVATDALSQSTVARRYQDS